MVALYDRRLSQRQVRKQMAPQPSGGASSSSSRGHAQFATLETAHRFVPDSMLQVLSLIAIIWAIVQLVLLELWPFLVIFLGCILLANPI